MQNFKAKYYGSQDNQSLLFIKFGKELGQCLENNLQDCFLQVNGAFGGAGPGARIVRFDPVENKERFTYNVTIQDRNEKNEENIKRDIIRVLRKYGFEII